MRLINFIRRLCLRFVIWSIEQHIEDLSQVMRETNSIDHYRLALIDRCHAKCELAKARQEFNNLLPVGVRRTWKTA